MTKNILVLNCEFPYNDCFSEKGDFRYTFARLERFGDEQRLRGKVWDDAVWVRRLKWEHPAREYLEDFVKSRLVRPQEG